MVIYLILLILTILWLGFIVLTPFLVHLWAQHSTFIKIYYFLFKFICHQKSDRSYFLWGTQLPVCARCLGIYGGLVVGLVIYPFFNKLTEHKVPKLKLSLIFILPILMDGIAQSLGLYTSSNIFRTIIGIWFSVGIIFFLLPVLNDIKKNYS